MTSMVATVDRIQAKATEFRPTKALLTLLAAPLFVLGFLAYTVYRVARLIVSWLWAATIVGWEAAAEARPERSP
ncbi:hypothetical protein [Prauserella muralis]|uniref:Uncharacterized protein n=1 Tax=Prauserella muralis TaxID=588067 RepID=A0A2V4AMC4_9PSEU|nr:hypothetical protein [Prauserella muralis]PXY21134.1 hypothetical protein BAY60_27085 [Prauserella muralis]TWE30222.1 hypothetical protein FHX69_2919 [Prauserella muralis]